MFYPPNIAGPAEIKSMNPVFVIQDINAKGLDFYFRIQVFNDPDMSEVIADINTLDNPELFEYSTNKGVTWSVLTPDNNKLPSGSLVKTKIYIGQKKQVWVRTGIGYLNIL